MAKLPGSASDPLWYKDALVYELHVRAFKDSNADGIGDFPGLLQKMDYLQDLGVTCIWLLPFFPSPLKDDGYDISDYMDVHPMYGTLDDFKAVLARPNETSTSGATPKKSIKTLELFSPIPKDRIGRGIPSPSNSSGTGFSPTSPISTTTIQESSPRF
jgi:hypothetical protein